MEPDDEGGDDHHRPVGDCPLLEPGGDATPLPEAVDAPLKDVAPPTGLPVEGEFAPQLVRAPDPLIVPLGDRVGNVAAPECLSTSRIAAALIADQVVGSCTFLVAVDAIAHMDAGTVRFNLSRDRVRQGPTYDPNMVREEEYWNTVYSDYGFLPFWAPGYRSPTFPRYPGIPR